VNSRIACSVPDPQFDANHSQSFGVFFIQTYLISIRSPGPVSPRDVECEGFEITYPRIAATSLAPSTLLEYDVDKKVDESIQSFLMTLSQIGPELLSVCALWRWRFFDVWYVFATGNDLHIIILNTFVFSLFHCC
jgi:hypothetical protein